MSTANAKQITNQQQQELHALRMLLKTNSSNWQRSVDLVLEYAGLDNYAHCDLTESTQITAKSGSVAYHLGHSTLGDFVVSSPDSNGLGMKWAVWADHLEASQIAENYGVKPKDISARRLIALNQSISNELGRAARSQTEWHSTRAKLQSEQLHTVTARISREARRHQEVAKDLKIQVVSLKKSAYEKQAQYKEVTKSLAVANSELKRLRESTSNKIDSMNEAYSRQIDAAKHRVEKLTAILNSAQQQQIALMSKIDTLETQLKTVNVEVIALKDKEEELSRASIKIVELEDTKAVLLNNVATAESNIQEILERESNLSSQNAQLEDRIQTASNDIESLQLSNEALSDQLKIADEQAQKLGSTELKLADTRDEIVRLNTVKSDLETKIADQEEKIHELTLKEQLLISTQIKLSESQAQLDNAIESCKQLSNRNEMLSKKSDEIQPLQQLVEEKTNEVRSLTYTRDQLKIEVERLKETELELQEAKSEINYTLSQISLLDSIKTELATQNKDLTAKLSVLNGVGEELDAVSEKYDALLDSHLLISHELATLSVEANHLRKSEYTLQSSVNMLRNELNTASSRHESDNVEINRLNSVIGTLHEQIDDLTSRIRIDPSRLDHEVFLREMAEKQVHSLSNQLDYERQNKSVLGAQLSYAEHIIERAASSEPSQSNGYEAYLSLANELETTKNELGYTLSSLEHARIKIEQQQREMLSSEKIHAQIVDEANNANAEMKSIIELCGQERFDYVEGLVNQIEKLEYHRDHLSAVVRSKAERVSSLLKQIKKYKAKISRLKQVMGQRRVWIQGTHNIIRLQDNVIKNNKSKFSAYRVRIIFLCAALSLMSTAALVNSDLGPITTFLISHVR